MVGRKEAPSGWVAPYRAFSIYYEELEIDLESKILNNDFSNYKYLNNNANHLLIFI